MKKGRIIKLSCSLMVCGALVASCKKEVQQQEQIPELAVETITNVDETLNTVYPATLHGENDIEIRPQISGFLTKVHVQEGEKVTKGQVLFTIDQVSLQAAVDAAKSQVSQAEAAVAVAKANVNTAQTNANNNKLLLDKNIISAPAYQTSVDALNAAKAQLNQAQAGVNAAKAQLISAQKNLSYSVVTAPASGVIGTIDYKEGALVSPSTLLTVLSNSSDVEAYFSFTESELLSLTNDGTRSIATAMQNMPPVKLVLANGTEYPYPGKIISISGVLDSSTGSATVKASFPNPDGLLRSGNTGNVLIPSVMTDVISIPQKATFEIQNMKYCFVVNDSAKLVSTPIKVSQQNDGQNYIVTDGLKAGDVILIEGVGVSAKDGMQIKPKNAQAAPAAESK